MWVGLLGAAVALNRGSHLGIDYFVAKLTVRKRLITQAFVFFVIFTFSLLILLIGGLQLVTDTLQLGQTTPATGVKVGYWYLSIPISGFFISIYSCEYFIEVLMKIKKDVS